MDAHQLMQYDAQKKSQGVAFFVWLFLGPVGIHRFYLGNPVGGLIYLALWVALIPTGGLSAIGLVVFYITDLFLIWGMTVRYNLRLTDRIIAPSGRS